MKNCTIIRSQRKSISLRMVEDGALQIRVPSLMTDTQIESFVNKHQSWIEKQRKEAYGRIEKKSNFRVAFHEKFLMMGKHYPLRPVDETSVGFNEEGFYAWKELPEALLKPEMVKLYRDLAKMILTVKVEKAGKKMGIYPKAVKVNKARTRWGSCSNRGNLNFSWYLIMAAESAVDYVVIHELAHFYEMNHSLKFWKIVEQFCPDYREEQAKLEKLQNIIATQRWE